jgi:hypothetical protein
MPPERQDLPSREAEPGLRHFTSPATERTFSVGSEIRRRRNDQTVSAHATSVSPAPSAHCTPSFSSAVAAPTD